MRVITVSNFRGGVGKTITTVNLATLCARRGLRTLLVDLGPQASATDYFGLYAEAERGANVIGLLYEGLPVADMSYATRIDNLRVVPATIALIDQNELLLAKRDPAFAKMPCRVADGVSDEQAVTLLHTANYFTRELNVVYFVALKLR